MQVLGESREMKNGLWEEAMFGPYTHFQIHRNQICRTIQCFKKITGKG